MQFMREQTIDCRTITLKKKVPIECEIACGAGRHCVSVRVHWEADGLTFEQLHDEEECAASGARKIIHSDDLRDVG